MPLSALASSVAAIRSLQRKKATVLIGIDGRGGCGKSTLASALARELSGSAIVPLDDFYRPDLTRPDLARLRREVLEPLAEGRDACYRAHDWATGRPGTEREVPAGQFIIVEGVWALDTDLAPFYDYRIWVDCPAEIGFRRGTARDLARDGVDNSDWWREFWLPQEARYITEQRPYERADVVVTTVDL